LESGADVPVLRHHGDDFDDVHDPQGRLTLIPVRDYVEAVPQTWAVDQPGRDKEPQNPINQCGPLLEGAIPIVTTNDFGSYLAAFDKRSNRQPPTEDDIEPASLLRARKIIADVDTSPYSWPEYEENELDRARWLAKFSPHKQTRMVSAWERTSCLGCSVCSGFLNEKKLSVKLECLLKRYDAKAAPRLIYASTDEFNAVTGPAVMVMTERLVELLEGQRIGPLKCKLAYKCDDVALAEFLDDPAYPHIAEGDFSANDLRQRRSVATLFDDWLFKLRAPMWLRKLFLGAIDFRVRNDAFGHKADLSNQLPTGTTITTIRNSTYNLTMEVDYAMETSNSGKCIILGDDYLGRLKKAVDCDHWSRFIGDYKMVLTGTIPDNMAAATIISRRVCHHTATRPCMMPKLGKALARFNVRVSQQAGVSDSAYMAGKALSYAYEFRHFPIFRDMFLSRFMSEDDRARVSVSEVSWFTRTSGVELTDLMEAIKREPTLISEDNTREFLMDAYGYTFGLEDARELASRIILNKDHAIVPMPDELRIDTD
jgi:hypothetical protein